VPSSFSLGSSGNLSNFVLCTQPQATSVTAKEATAGRVIPQGTVSESRANVLVEDIRDRFAHRIASAPVPNFLSSAGSINFSPFVLGESAKAHPSSCRRSGEETGFQRWRADLHDLLEEPTSSRWANWLSVIMGLNIVVSVLTLVAQPLVSTSPGATLVDEEVWKGFEVYFTVIFSAEFLLRLSVADATGEQTLKGFILNPGNMLDFTALLPLFLELALKNSTEDATALRLLRIARLLRLSRIIKMTKLNSRWSTFGPSAVVLSVIWGIYLNHLDDGDAGQ